MRARKWLRNRSMLAFYRADDKSLNAFVTKYGAELDGALKESVKAVQYDWPAGRITVRKNGQTVGSPRNIVDLGGLLRSQRRDRPSATELRFIWGTPYASAVLRGYTTNRGTVVPGRDWIKPALEAKPLDAFFAAEWRKLAARGL
jgi:hypothetical protein